MDFRVGDRVKLVQRRDLYGETIPDIANEWKLDTPYIISAINNRNTWLGPNYAFQGTWDCVNFEGLEGYWFRSDDLEYAAEPGTYCSLGGEKVYFVGVDPNNSELAVIIDHERDVTRCYIHNFMPWREPPKKVVGYAVVVRGAIKTKELFFLENIQDTEKEAHEVFERENDGSIELVEILKIEYEEKSEKPVDI
jgi:hypothetical protein